MSINKPQKIQNDQNGGNHAGSVQLHDPFQSQQFLGSAFI